MENLTVLISRSSVLNRQTPSYAFSRRWPRSHMNMSLLRDDAQPTALRDSMVLLSNTMATEWTSIITIIHAKQIWQSATR